MSFKNIPKRPVKLDYLYLRAWSRYMGSDMYYTERQLAKARLDEAPQTAIYYSKEEKRWHTADEIKMSETKEMIESIVEAMKTETH